MTQQSAAAKRAAHSSRGQAAKQAATSPAGRIPLPGHPVGPLEQAAAGLPEFALEGAHRHVAPVGAAVNGVARQAAGEEIGAAGRRPAGIGQAQHGEVGGARTLSVMATSM